MRRDRKIIMGIRQPNNIKPYIEVDVESIKDKPKSEMTNEQTKILDEKDKFKAEFAQKLSNIHLRHIFEAIKKINNGQGSIPDPAKSKEKKEAFDLKEKRIREIGRLDPALENAMGTTELQKQEKLMQEESLFSDNLSDMSIDQDPILKHISGAFEKVRQQVDQVGSKYYTQKTTSAKNSSSTWALRRKSRGPNQQSDAENMHSVSSAQERGKFLERKKSGQLKKDLNRGDTLGTLENAL